jgi:hypothetical protein
MEKETNASVQESSTETAIKSAAEWAIEEVRAAEKALEAAKAKVLAIKADVESELGKIKALGEDVVDKVEDIVEDGKSEVKSHPVLSSIILFVAGAIVGAVTTFILK